MSRGGGIMRAISPFPLTACEKLPARTPRLRKVPLPQGVGGGRQESRRHAKGTRFLRSGPGCARAPR